MRSYAMVLGVVVLCIGMAQISGVLVTRAGAHDLWIEATNYAPEAGSDVTLALVYGHEFPGTEYLPEEYLEEMVLLDPKGKRIELKQGTESGRRTCKAAKLPGTYVATAVTKGRFWTKTTEGYQSGRSKQGLQDVISCTYSAKFAKAILHVEHAGSSVVSEPLGHDLEIVPLKDPKGLSAGDELPVKVLYKGGPLPYAQLLATYAGFSSDKNVFAYAVKTNPEGLANIRLLHPGAWLVTAGHRDTFPDTEVCDQYSFGAALTFRIP